MTEKASWCRQTLDSKMRRDLRSNLKIGQGLEAVGVSHSILQLEFELIDDN